MKLEALFTILQTISTIKEVDAILTKYEDGLNNPENLADLIERSLDADKAEDIQTIDLRGQTAVADYMIVASGRSSRQVGALAEKLRDRLKGLGVDNVRLEGMNSCDWVILDAGDVIVHIFRPEVRSFYNIERMWDMKPPEITGGVHAM